MVSEWGSQELEVSHRSVPRIALKLARTWSRFVSSLPLSKSVSHRAGLSIVSVSAQELAVSRVAQELATARKV